MSRRRPSGNRGCYQTAEPHEQHPESWRVHGRSGMHPGHEQESAHRCEEHKSQQRATPRPPVGPRSDDEDEQSKPEHSAPHGSTHIAGPIRAILAVRRVERADSVSMDDEHDQNGSAPQNEDPRRAEPSCLSGVRAHGCSLTRCASAAGRRPQPDRLHQRRPPPRLLQARVRRQRGYYPLSWRTVSAWYSSPRPRACDRNTTRRSELRMPGRQPQASLQWGRQIL